MIISVTVNLQAVLSNYIFYGDLPRVYKWGGQNTG